MKKRGRKRQKNLVKFLPIILGVIFGLILSIFIFQKIKSQLAQTKKEKKVVTKKTIKKISVPTVITPAPTASVIIPAASQQSFCLNVPVLIYHHIKPLDQAKKEGYESLAVGPEYFESQMKYLVDQGYTTIKAENLVNALINGQGIPGKPVVVTFDDGYDDIYLYAYPIAKKYNITLNLMVATGLLENSGYLTWSSLKEMTDSGLAAVYNHTWSHYPLASGDENKITIETQTAQKQLEDHLDNVAKIITYPYDSYNGRIITIMSNEGFIAGFSTEAGFFQCNSFIMNLHRNRIGNAPLSAYGL